MYHNVVSPRNLLELWEYLMEILIIFNWLGLTTNISSICSERHIPMLTLGDSSWNCTADTLFWPWINFIYSIISFTLFLKVQLQWLPSSPVKLLVEGLFIFIGKSLARLWSNTWIRYLQYKPTSSMIRVLVASSLTADITSFFLEWLYQMLFYHLGPLYFQVIRFPYLLTCWW